MKLNYITRHSINENLDYQDELIKIYDDNNTPLMFKAIWVEMYIKDEMGLDDDVNLASVSTGFIDPPELNNRNRPKKLIKFMFYYKNKLMSYESRLTWVLHDSIS